MTKASYNRARRLAQQLAATVHDMHKYSRSFLGGVTMREANLQDLRKKAAQLVQALADGQPREHILEYHRDLSEAVNVAGATGLLNEEDLKECFSQLDAIAQILEDPPS